MKRARFTEEQIIAVLREHEAGAKTADLASLTPCLRHRSATETPDSFSFRIAMICFCIRCPPVKA